MSVARPLRSTLEQVADALPDIVMLIIGLLIFAKFWGPLSGFIGSITGFIGGATGAVGALPAPKTGASITTTGTTGHIQDTGNRYNPIAPVQQPRGRNPIDYLNPYNVHPPQVGAFTGNRFAWTQAYSGSYTPINRFFRQLIYEGRQ